MCMYSLSFWVGLFIFRLLSMGLGVEFVVRVCVVTRGHEAVVYLSAVPGRGRGVQDVRLPA